MLVREIFDSLQSLEVQETRCIYDHYGEIVFEKKYVQEWMAGLIQFLGAPQKSAGENPTKEDLALTFEYRGIRRDQTLFYKRFEGYSILAMLWPWASSNVTLIVAKVVEKK